MDDIELVWRMADEPAADGAEAFEPEVEGAALSGSDGELIGGMAANGSLGPDVGIRAVDGVSQMFRAWPVMPVVVMLVRAPAD